MMTVSESLSPLYDWPLFTIAIRVLGSSSLQIFYYTAVTVTTRTTTSSLCYGSRSRPISCFCHSDNKVIGEQLYKVIETIFDKYEIVYMFELDADGAVGGKNKAAEIFLSHHTRRITLPRFSNYWYRIVKCCFKPFYNERMPSSMPKLDNIEQEFGQDAPAAIPELYVLTHEMFMHFTEVWDTARKQYAGTPEDGPPPDAPYCNRHTHNIQKDVGPRQKGQATPHLQNAATLLSSIGGLLHNPRTSHKQMADESSLNNANCFAKTDPSNVSQAPVYNSRPSKKQQPQRDTHPGSC